MPDAAEISRADAMIAPSLMAPLTDIMSDLLEFAEKRYLYSAPILDIPLVAHDLAFTFARYRQLETHLEAVATPTNRSLKGLGGDPLVGALIRHLVPKILKQAAVISGARHYLRNSPHSRFSGLAELVEEALANLAGSHRQIEMLMDAKRTDLLSSDLGITSLSKTEIATNSRGLSEKIDTTLEALRKVPDASDLPLETIMHLHDLVHLRSLALVSQQLATTGQTAAWLTLLCTDTPTDDIELVAATVGEYRQWSEHRKTQMSLLEPA